MFPRLLVAVLCLAAFGPYLVGSIRTEQLFVYASTGLVLFTFVRLRSWTVGLLAAWAWIVLIALIGYAFPYRGLAPWVPGSLVAGLDNFLLPLAVMLVIWSNVSPAAAEPALRVAAKVIVWGSAVNAVLAAVSTTTDTESFLRPFWSNQEAMTTVAERAMGMGRHSGVFGQPAEAGLVYSVAVVLVAWIFSRRPALMYSLFAVITVGGMLSVSKVFLLVGLPVALVLVWATQRGSGRAGLIGSVLILSAVLSASTFFQEWSGLEYLTRLLEVPADQSLIEFYTAGRWTSDSAMLGTIGFVLGASPLAGMGIAGLSVPYDSAWTEVIVMGGVLGTAGMVAVFVLLLVRFLKIRDSQLRLVGLAFWAVLLGGSLGIPALTANRAATLVWVVAALFVAISARDAAQPSGGHAGVTASVPSA